MKKFFKRVSATISGNDVKCAVNMTFLDIFAKVNKLRGLFGYDFQLRVQPCELLLLLAHYHCFLLHRCLIVIYYNFLPILLIWTSWSNEMQLLSFIGSRLVWSCLVHFILFFNRSQSHDLGLSCRLVITLRYLTGFGILQFEWFLGHR